MSSGYVGWDEWEQSGGPILLDGKFTAQELEELAAIMREAGIKEKA